MIKRIILEVFEEARRRGHTEKTSSLNGVEALYLKSSERHGSGMNGASDEAIRTFKGAAEGDTTSLQL